MVFARSKCPKCGNQLKWYMNIPLLSYLFLRGKCAFCKTKISIQYPVVEFLTAVLFLISLISFGLTLKTLFLCIIFSVFILLSVTDIKETVILDYHAYILAFLGVLASIFNIFEINLLNSIVGGILGFLIFEILSRIGAKLIGLRAFGEGDSLIALGLGAVFGIKTLLIIIPLSFLVQSITAIPILIKKAFVENKKALGFSYVIVFTSIVAIFLINYFNVIQNELHYLILALVISILLIISLKNIISEIRNKKELIKDLNEEEKYEDKTFNLLPFGPALIISATICIFYLPQIKAIVKSFLF